MFRDRSHTGPPTRSRDGLFETDVAPVFRPVVGKPENLGRSAPCTTARVVPDRPRRLRDFPDVGYQRYFLTVCTADRHWAFDANVTAHEAIVHLRRSARSHDFALAAYCFMPDHVHVLVYGTTERADFRAFALLFKKLTGFYYRKHVGRRLWQAGHYEHVLRADEMTDTVARCILENPIRAGLSQALGEHPSAGSGLFDCRLV